jgi:hypothetical protein
MRCFVFSIRTILVAVPVLALSAYATPDYTSQLVMAPQSACTESTVVICRKHSSRDQDCGCVARHEYQAMLQATRQNRLR